jgi:phenylacetate-CoA ligase
MVDASGLRDLQVRRLAETLARARAMPLYKGRIDPGLQIEGLGDLTRLPVTTKQDLRALPRLDSGLAVPRSDIRRWHASSGTTGRRTAVGYSESDLTLWTEVTARALAHSGIGRGTVVHNAFGYGLFTGGLGFQLALDRLGATVIPASIGPTLEDHLSLMADFGAEALLSTPSFAARLAARRPNLPDLRIGVHGGESWTPALRARIEDGLGITVFNTYGLSEIIGPGVAHECTAHQGLHLYEDHFLAEVVTPGTTDPVPEGEVGELLLTTLSAQACPRLRYRTGDQVRLQSGPCSCGQNTRRITEVLGRLSDQLHEPAPMPTAIEQALLSLPDAGVHYQLHLRPERRLTRVHLEPRHGLDPVTWPRLAGQAAAALAVIGADVPIEVVAPGSLPRSSGKAPRIVQLREHA